MILVSIQRTAVNQKVDPRLPMQLLTFGDSERILFKNFLKKQK